MRTIKRVYHPWFAWECYRAGFYATGGEDRRAEYVRFFSNLQNFESTIDRVFSEWPNSCEHFLTNPNINRIAWLGQASVCVAWGVPSCFKAGFLLLDIKKQEAANGMAREAIQGWIDERIANQSSGEVCQAMAQRWLPGWDTRRIASGTREVIASSVVSAGCVGIAAK